MPPPFAFPAMLDRLFRLGTVILYGTAALALSLLSLAFIVTAVRMVWSGFAAGGGPETATLLEAIGLTIVALAVFDVAKYLVEEEILRDRELRSAAEARKTLTKFLTIVVIVVSLESIVFVFQAGKQDLTQLIYPAALLVAVALLVGVLGHYQRESREAEEGQGGPHG